MVDETSHYTISDNKGVFFSGSKEKVMKKYIDCVVEAAKHYYHVECFEIDEAIKKAQAFYKITGFLEEDLNNFYVIIIEMFMMSL